MNEDSKVSRRGFFIKLGIFLNAAVGVAVTVPVLGYLFGPAMRRGTRSWISLGSLEIFPEGQTRMAEFLNPSGEPWDGMTAKTACWVRRVSAEKFQVFAVNCAHLGCPVRWFEQSGLFLCPCHGGAYYADGQRAAGPPQRGLFEYLVKITKGELMIDAGELPTLDTEARLKKYGPNKNGNSGNAPGKDNSPCNG